MVDGGCDDVIDFLMDAVSRLMFRFGSDAVLFDCGVTAAKT